MKLQFSDRQPQISDCKISFKTFQGLLLRTFTLNCRVVYEEK